MELLTHRLVDGLIQHHHPEFTELDYFLQAGIEQLPELWQEIFPESGPVINNSFQTVRAGNQVLKVIPYRKLPEELLQAYKVRSFLRLLRDLEHYLKGMSTELGNLTPRIRQTVRQLNLALDRGKGLDMFHHGFDSDNPFSKPGDVCPATGVTPFTMGGYMDTMMVTKAEEMLRLVYTLKSHGFYVQTNPLWGEQAQVSMISRRFIWVSQCLRGIADLEADPVLTTPIRLPDDWPEPDKAFLKRVGKCLSPDLYDNYL